MAEPPRSTFTFGENVRELPVPDVGPPQRKNPELRPAVEYDILKRLRKLERRFETHEHDIHELESRVQELEDQTWDSSMDDDH